MAKIKNIGAYPIDANVSLNDYLIGTNSDSTGTTLNYRIGDITGLMLNTLGLVYGNVLLSGRAVWLSGLTFNVTALSYLIDNKIYYSVGVDITLSAADAINGRIDLIVVDKNGLVSIAVGTPSPTPIKPDITLLNVVEVTSILIPALATSPSGVTEDLIYDENIGSPVEWVATENTLNQRIKLEYGGAAHSGGKNIRIDTSTLGGTLTLVSDTVLSFSNFDTLHFYMRSEEIWTVISNMTVTIYNGANAISNNYELSEGIGGITSTNSNFHGVSIPFSTFLLNDTSFDKITISFNNVNNLYLDSIRVVGGVNTIPLIGELLALQDVFETDYSTKATYILSVKADESGMELIPNAAGGVTDHTLLTNIGTNTHVQIDTHIADATIHFTEASISITESQISDLQSYLLSTRTKAQFNTALTDGTFLFVGDAPTAHTHVEADITDLQSYLLAADIDTLAELNTIITDATLVDTADIFLNADLSTNGLVVRTADGIYTSRSVTSTDVDHLVVTNGDGVSGNPDISLTANVVDLFGLYDGMYLDQPVVTVTSNGTVITLSIEDSGGGDLRVHFSTGVFNWDTTPADTVSLTAGTDASPVLNYIYLLESTSTLTSSTIGFPSIEYAPVATVLCQSAATLQTDGAYKVHAWTDHIKALNNNGHISHTGSWIRKQHATWETGVVLTPTITTNGGAEDNIDISTTTGNILQLHDHSFPIFNTSTGSNIYVVNHNAAAYTKITDLNAANQDDAGNSISNNQHINIVIWGTVNEVEADSKIFVNLPSDFHGNNSTQAVEDAQKFSNYNIPSDYKGTGFLIARLTLKYNSASSGTWTLIENLDLRGQFPSTFAGGSAATSTLFIDTTFRILDNLDETKEIAFQASGITTATTRTITIPDVDVTLATPTELTKLAGIEALADVTDTANVTSAGALMDSEVDVDIKTLVLPANTTISTFGASLVDDTTATIARTTLDVDQAGTDNSTDVTVTDSAEIDFTLVGQNITASIIAGSIDETKLDASTNTSLNLADSSLQSADIGVSVQAYSAVLDATTASFLIADETKLDGIEALATADQTSIVGITGTKAQFDTALTDGLFTHRVGTPIDGQIGIWTDASTQEGTSELIYNTSTRTLQLYEDSTAGNSRTISLGRTTLENFQINAISDGINTTLDAVGFSTNTTSGVGNAGEFRFNVDGTLNILRIHDTGITTTGSVTATSYNGSGTNLTGIDADFLSGITSSQFLRSDVADIKSSGDLTLNSGIRLEFGTAGTVGSEVFYQAGSDTNFWKLKTGDLIIQDNSATRFTFGRTTGDLTNTGNIISQGTGDNSFVGDVGVGIGVPLATLHVDTQDANGTGWKRAVKLEAGVSDGDGAFIEFSSSSADGFGIQLGGIREGAGGLGAFIIKTGASSQTEKFRITDAGLVGLNTIPTEKLHILGTTSEDPFLLVEHNSGSAGHAGIQLSSKGSGGLVHSIISGDTAYTHGSGLHILSASTLLATFGNSGNFNIIGDVSIDDNAATGVGLQLTGGGSGATLAKFTRDVGATGASVEIHANSNFPTMTFASNSLIYSIGVNTSNEFVIADAANLIGGATERLIITSTGDATFSNDIFANGGDKVITTKDKTIVIENPSATEDISMFPTDKAITITKIIARLVGSATPSVSWTIKHGTDRSAAGAAVVTAGTTTTSVTTGHVITTFNDATVIADSAVWIETTAQSGTVTELSVTIIYTED